LIIKRDEIKEVSLVDKRIIFGPLRSLLKLFNEDEIIYVGDEERNRIHFPLKDLSLLPFENFKLALKVGVAIGDAIGKVVYACDAGCGRSGSLAVATLSYLGLDELAIRLFEEVGCPELREHLETAMAVGRTLKERGAQALDELELVEACGSFSLFT